MAGTFDSTKGNTAEELYHMKGGEKEEHLQSKVFHGIHAKPPEGRRGRWCNVVDTISLLSSFYLSLLDAGNEASTKFCGDALAAP